MGTSWRILVFKMFCMSVKILAMVAVVTSLNVAQGDPTCAPTSVQDIIDAGECVNMMEWGDPKVGSKITGAEYYVITALHLRHFNWLGSKNAKDANSLQTVTAIVAEKETDPPTTIIAYMGSTKTGLMQYIQQYSEHSTTITINGKRMSVLTYYWKAFQLLNLHKLVEIKPGRRYLVTGHSLGGAMASIHSLVMTEEQGGALWKHNDTRMITFGEPRLGKTDYVTYHDEWIPAYKKLRIINNRDPVPHLKSIFVMPRKGFFHESREIWMKRTGSEKIQVKCKVSWWPFNCYKHRYVYDWKVCSLGDAQECSETAIDPLVVTSLMEHQIYNYVAVARIMALDEKKKQRMKFMEDQCSAYKM